MRIPASYSRVVRRCQSSEKGQRRASPTSRRRARRPHPGAGNGNAPHAPSEDTQLQTGARRSVPPATDRERRPTGRFSASANTAMSVSRLNSAAPYRTHACPPISRYRTPLWFNSERTLRIGFGVKRASHLQEKIPELLAFPPALPRRKAIPLQPLGFQAGCICNFNLPRVGHIRIIHRSAPGPALILASRSRKATACAEALRVLDAAGCLADHRVVVLTGGDVAGLGVLNRNTLTEFAGNSWTNRVPTLLMAMRLLATFSGSATLFTSCGRRQAPRRWP